MKKAIIILSVLLAIAITYIIIRPKKTIETKIKVFVPDAKLIKEVVYLKADLAVKTTQLEDAQKKIKTYEYKKPAPINGNDSDLSRAFRAILPKIR